MMNNENTQSLSSEDPCGQCESGCVCDPNKCPCVKSVMHEKPESSWIWMKDSSGYPSITVTFLTVSFWITTLAYIASMVHGIGSIQFRNFDTGASAAYFGLIASLYFGRRFTDAKYGNPNVANTDYVGYKK